MAKKRKTMLVPCIATGVAVAALAGGYVGMSIYYNNHFFPNSSVNGQDVTRLKKPQAAAVLADGAFDYSFTVTTRTGAKYEILGDEFDYSFEKSGSVEEFLDKQNGWSWISNISKKHEYEITTTTSYSEDKLRQAASKLECFDEENQIPPTDARIEKSDGEIKVIKESQGDEIVVDVALEKIISAVADGKNSVTFGDDCYKKPAITSQSEEITSVMDKVNKCYSASITYVIGEDTEVLDSETIKTWISIDDNNELIINEAEAAEFAQKLASKYNTYGDRRKFKTSEGDVIEIGGGDYGWVIDKPKEANQIIEDIKAGKEISRDPIYSQVANVPGLNDIGDSYVEIDYTNQHVYYYKEGKLVFDSDVVTGNISRNNGSPDGVFKVVYKKSPATLVGEGYSSAVKYFMVFAYNVGFHDATWRSSFGGQIYKTNGSHGCINMPLAKAKELYEILEVDTPVIAYYREPVVLTAENAKISNAFSYKKSDK